MASVRNAHLQLMDRLVELKPHNIDHGCADDADLYLTAEHIDAVFGAFSVYMHAIMRYVRENTSEPPFSTHEVTRLVESIHEKISFTGDTLADITAAIEATADDLADEEDQR